ncbi:hypothetical protein [Chondrinema litorale]|uniref:hypothetical protein n=1 Tax=Chondrinema litorale TaxID=2994555 RepID=UPI0025428CF0|nr:hypothetical protein [Chondrinema litorale]UZR97260.1 hypothetical protein OQ292_25505 [Chondrinema litorale]
MKKVFTIFCVFLFFGTYLQAQQTITASGYSFKVPAGWEASTAEGAYFLTSEFNKGFIMVGNDALASKDKIRQDLLTPYNDGNVMLQSTGVIDDYTANILGSKVTGSMQGVNCEAYLVNIIVPDVTLVNVMAIVEAESYSDFYKQMALEISQSVSKVSTSSTNKNVFSGNSNTNSGGNLGNAANKFTGRRIASISTNGEYAREKEVIDFCSNGTFSIYSFSGYSVGTAADMGEANQSGYWKFNGSGNSYTLTLTTADGNTGDIPVKTFIDKYGDEMFAIGGKNYGYYGEAKNCY